MKPKPEDARTVKELIISFNAGHRPEYIFFWRHTPPEDGSANQSCLSQWYAASFEVEKIRFPTAEHYMMYRKAELFGDSDAAAKVMQSDNPGAAKAVGRSVRNFQRETWNKHCVETVTLGNINKFAQNRVILNYLLATDNKVLAEASPYDGVWGIGLGSDAKGIENPLTWKGKNLLGFALMEARARLREQLSSDFEKVVSKVKKRPVPDMDKLK
ncbi:MAG: NADAR family protein [Candidatus Electrothrix communis]|nr:MAG: NADAR family protein [Candidatus Electrothrix communis]